MKASPSLRKLNTRLRMSVTEFAVGGKWAIEFPKETRHNLRNFFFDGVSASASDSIILTYLTLYLLALGASSADIGLMTSLASLGAVLLLIPGAVLVDRTGKRKQIVLISGGSIRRIAIFLLAIIPLVFSGSAAVYIIIALKVIMDGTANLGLPAWISMTADIVPIARRGRYFGSRNMAMGIATMVTTYLVGMMITGIGSPQGYQWAMGISFIIGAMSTFFFSRIHESESTETQAALETKSSYSLKALLSTLRSDRNFMIFCGFAAFWTFSINIAAPFFSVYLVQDLKATASMVGLTTIASQLAGIPAQKFFGGLADKVGAHKLMMVTAIIIPVLPILWFFSSEFWHIFPINILGGTLWAGYNIASFNFLLIISPVEQRARYTAMYQIAVSSAVALGAAVGGIIVNYWALPVVFVLSGIGRIISAGIFAKFVHVPQEEQVILEPA